MNGDHIKMVEDCRQELITIQTWIASNRLNSNVKYLVSYAVIKASGTTERIFKNIIFDYLNTGVNNETSNYLNATVLMNSSNPTHQNICTLLNKINRTWNSNFKRLCEKNVVSDLESLVELRNSFSHGGSILSSIDNIIQYFESAVKILYILDSVVNSRDV